MYLWNIDRLIENLRKNTISKKAKTVFYIFSPLVSIFNSFFFGALLCSHQVISNFFAHFLEQAHPQLSLYNMLALVSAVTTTLITFGGFYLCYQTNKAGDGKKFSERMACLSFPINFHLTVYVLAFLAIMTLIGYMILHGKIILFKNQILSLSKQDPSIGQALQNSTLQSAVKIASRSKGFFDKVLDAPITILKLSAIPGKINTFLKTARASILVWYPLLCLLPPTLSLCHYLVLRRMIRKVSS
jgi:hypothetical protein